MHSELQNFDFSSQYLKMQSKWWEIFVVVVADIAIFDEADRKLEIDLDLASKIKVRLY